MIDINLCNCIMIMFVIAAAPNACQGVMIKPVNFIKCKFAQSACLGLIFRIPAINPVLFRYIIGNGTHIRYILFISHKCVHIIKNG